MDSRVTERPDMRDRLIAPVIAGGVAPGAAARMAGYVRRGGRPSSRSPGAHVVVTGDGCAAGGPMRPRSRMPPRGLVLITSHPGAAPCDDLALGGAGHADRLGRGRHDRPARPLIPAAAPAPAARPRPGLGRRVLRPWPAVRVRARRAARRSSPEQIAPASAGSRTARTGTARRPG